MRLLNPSGRCRCRHSAASNIAEGSKRHTNPDYARFLNIAEGSVTEVEYLFILSRDLGYLAAQVAEPLIAEAQEISRMLYALRTKVEQAV